MAPKAPGGIKKNKGGGVEMTVPEFAMPPDAVPGIAQVIVDIWQQTKPNLDKIFDRTNGVATVDAVKQATAAINAALPGYNLKSCVIIKESEHDDGYTAELNDVVFVLPHADRVNLGGANLLDTAKLLMACTPNGIRNSGAAPLGAFSKWPAPICSSYVRSARTTTKVWRAASASAASGSPPSGRRWEFPTCCPVRNTNAAQPGYSAGAALCVCKAVNIPLTD